MSYATMTSLHDCQVPMMIPVSTGSFLALPCEQLPFAARQAEGATFAFVIITLEMLAMHEILAMHDMRAGTTKLVVANFKVEVQVEDAALREPP